jgi:hypothetical protein
MKDFRALGKAASSPGKKFQVFKQRNFYIILILPITFGSLDPPYRIRIQSGSGPESQNQGFGSGFNQVSRSGSVFGIRIRIQEGKMTHKSRKN